MRPLLLLLVAVATGGIAVAYEVVRPTTAAHAPSSVPIAREGLAPTNPAAPSPVALPRHLPTATELLAAGGESASDRTNPASVRPSAEPPLPDDVELLNEAIAAGDLEVVRAMIAAGFPMNTDDDGRHAPLDVARVKARGGDATAAKIVALLEQHGALVRAVEPPEEPDTQVQDEAYAGDIDRDQVTVVIDGPVKHLRTPPLVYF